MPRARHGVQLTDEARMLSTGRKQRLISDVKLLAHPAHLMVKGLVAHIGDTTGGDKTAIPANVARALSGAALVTSAAAGSGSGSGAGGGSRSRRGTAMLDGEGELGDRARELHAQSLRDLTVGHPPATAFGKSMRDLFSNHTPQSAGMKRTMSKFSGALTMVRTARSGRRAAVGTHTARRWCGGGHRKWASWRIWTPFELNPMTTIRRRRRPCALGAVAVHAGVLPSKQPTSRWHWDGTASLMVRQVLGVPLR